MRSNTCNFADSGAEDVVAVNIFGKSSETLSFYIVRMDQ
jgi:hypothetical protein